MNNKGFIIHGHNNSLKNEVARFIDKELNKEAIILHEQSNKGKTIIEKFEANSDVYFAIAIWSADDFGGANGRKETEIRARQNVIFETGFFAAKLGREKLIILHEDNVTIPSDLQGYVYCPLEGQWKDDLRKEIEAIYSIQTNDNSEIDKEKEKSLNEEHINAIYKDLENRSIMANFQKVIESVELEKYHLMNQIVPDIFYDIEIFKYLLGIEVLAIKNSNEDKTKASFKFTNLGLKIKKRFIKNNLKI